MPFKVTNFGINRKFVCNNHIMYCAVSEILRMISHICCRQLVPLFNALVWGEPLNSKLENLTSRNEKRPCVVWCKAYVGILNRFGMDHKCDRQTGGQA